LEHFKHVQSASFISTYRQLLKTFLFQQSFLAKVATAITVDFVMATAILVTLKMLIG